MTVDERRNKDKFTIDLGGCARCDGDGHPGIEFTKLTYPVEPFSPDGEVNIQPYTHWAPCPTNGEPILMQIFDDPDESDTKVP